MIVSDTPTAHARRYLQQLCKHWSHRFEVSHTEDTGQIALPMGRVSLSAGPRSLLITLEPVDGADIDKMKEVVASHIDRFAFREAPLAHDWRIAA